MSNQNHAQAAITAASFLTDHIDLPEIAAFEIIRGYENHTSRIHWQLADSTCPLHALTEWADTLSGDIAASVLHKPGEYVSLHVTGHADDCPTQVWAHLPDSNAGDLWDAIGLEPDLDVRCRVSLDALRAAATSLESISDNAEAAA